MRRLSKFFQSLGRRGSTRDRAPGRIGFMSTQKRETPRKRAICTERAPAAGIRFAVSVARYVCAAALGRTAPLWSIVWSVWAWFHPRGNQWLPGTLKAATKFLHKDQPYRQGVQLEFAAERSGAAPPVWACGRQRRQRLVFQLAACGGLPASPGHPAIPLPPGFASLAVTLPHAPAPVGRAERQDGKRDLYFLYAA